MRRPHPCLADVLNYEHHSLDRKGDEPKPKCEIRHYSVLLLRWARTLIAGIGPLLSWCSRLIWLAHQSQNLEGITEKFKSEE
jgi:hypothetical protein